MFVSAKRAPAATILVVEDKPKLARLLTDSLSAGGYETICVADGALAVQQARTINPDVIIIDMMLPGKDGLTVCKELREFTATPIIMLTARIAEIDRLLRLELGADDYICKPFGPREVVARVKTVLRRSGGPRRRAARGLRIVIDASRFEVSLDGRVLELTPLEFRLLQTLLSQPGRTFSRHQLLEQLYDDRRVVLDRTVDSHVKNLRRKLGRIAPDDEFIRSMYGLGYRLDLPPHED